MCENERQTQQTILLVFTTQISFFLGLCGGDGGDGVNEAKFCFFFSFFFGKENEILMKKNYCFSNPSSRERFFIVERHNFSLFIAKHIIL